MSGREGHSKGCSVYEARAHPIAVCLVIDCVQRAGKIWVIVGRETAWSHIRVGVPSVWMYSIML